MSIFRVLSHNPGAFHAQCGYKKILNLILSVQNLSQPSVSPVGEEHQSWMTVKKRRSSAGARDAGEWGQPE